LPVPRLRNDVALKLEDERVQLARLRRVVDDQHQGPRADKGLPLPRVPAPALTGTVPVQAAMSRSKGRAGELPRRQLRARLEDVVAGSELVFPVRRLASDGLDAWEQVMQRGYEGLVGGPTRRWLNVKQKGWTVEEDGWQRRISVTPILG
jgi:hypothetical protein